MIHKSKECLARETAEWAVDRQKKNQQEEFYRRVVGGEKTDSAPFACIGRRVIDSGSIKWS